MILSRRKAHFYTVVILSAVLPLVFFAGLLWRPSIPTVDETTDELFAAANFPSQKDAAGVIASETLLVNSIKVLAETSKSYDGAMFLELEPTEALQFSNILVYWRAGNSAPNTVDEKALLLGQLSGSSRRRFSVPSAMQGQSGHLLFYSRGQDEVIGSSPLPANTSIHK
ncbi:MAG: hypothetical protein F6K14_06115 [Symploca sp. SIO2C1]|nr:hypothetical protein [Symploca sp. SIO2C1]